MKKTISFKKQIEFPSMIGEITSISLEDTLKFTNESNIEGDLIVSGTYKLTEASRIEEKFEHKLPTEIILVERLDLDSAKISISDFYYEIEGDYNLVCYIDVLVEGVEIIDVEKEETEESINVQEAKVANFEPEETKEKVSAEVETEPVTTPVEIPAIIEQPVEVEEPVIDEVQTENTTMAEEDDYTCDGDRVADKKEEGKDENTIKTEEHEAMPVSSLFENINESEETYSTYSVYVMREEETINSIIDKYKTTKEELESYNDISNLTVGSKIIIPQHDN